MFQEDIISWYAHWVPNSHRDKREGEKKGSGILGDMAPALQNLEYEHDAGVDTMTD